LSDTHCKLEWELLAKYKQENISYDNILHPMSPNYIWDDESAVRFTMALGSDEIQNQLQLFNSKTILGSQTSVDEASAELSKNIDLAAFRSFKKKKVKDKKTKQK
jgi:hypothetical protein